MNPPLPHEPNLQTMRIDYDDTLLSEQSIASDPIEEFRKWLDQAMIHSVNTANSMTLATATAEGKPSARTVLLRDFNEQGYTFYTNYQSRKAHELEANPYATLLFFWPEMERQIRIEGTIEKLSWGESNAYFQSRPRQSQIGAWISPQSEMIHDRETMEKEMLEFEKKHVDKIIPCPSFWGGYRVIPFSYEFWKGRPNRLHDRILFSYASNQTWQISRLAP